MMMIKFDAAAGIGMVIGMALLISLINKILIGGFFPFPRGPKASESTAVIRDKWKNDRLTLFQNLLKAVLLTFIFLYSLGTIGRILQCSFSTFGCSSRQQLNFLDVSIVAVAIAIWFGLNFFFNLLKLSRRKKQ